MTDPFHDHDLANHKPLTRLLTDASKVRAQELTIEQARANWRAGHYAGVDRALAGEIMGAAHDPQPQHPHD